MLDKCDVRTDTLIPFRRDFREWLAPVEFAVTHGHRKLPRGWSEDLHHRAIGSMAEFGIDGYFHGWLKHKRKDGKQTHKIELNQVGDGPISRIYADLERIVDHDPMQLSPMRLDCAANIPEVPVSFFQHHMRVALKRRGAKVLEFADPYFEHLYGRGETMYFGARPNCVRVYDKTAEMRVKDYGRFERECLKAGVPKRDIPTFQQRHGVKETDVITRVERQMTGEGLPKTIATLGQLKTLSEFDPFENVRLFYGESQLPTRHDGRYTFAQYECGLNLRSMQQAFGLDYTSKHLRKHVGKNNFKREWERYLPFFLVNSTSEGISREAIVEIYRQSISKQLAA